MGHRYYFTVKHHFTSDSYFSFSSQILVVNDTACRLLGYSADELSRLTLRELFRQRRTPQMSLSEAQQLDSDGNMVVCSGKVVGVKVDFGYALLLTSGCC